MSRPNFVFFIPDQLRADAIGAFGSPIARTPHLDAFAKTAVRMDNAFTQHSVCSPSRVSFLTGLYPHTRGRRTLTDLIRPDEPNLLRYLKEDGYYVTHIGKRGDTFAPGATELSVHDYGFAVEPTVSTFGRFSHTDMGTAIPRTFYVGRIDEPEGTIDNDEAMTRSAEAWLADAPDQPWALYLPLFAPHCPFAVTDPWYSMYDRAEMPGRAVHTEGHQPAYVQHIRDTWGLDAVTDEQWREIQAVYYGMISRMDDQFGRLMAALEANGLRENTVVLFFADHGEYLGDFGLIEKWPAGVHDVLVRDPLLIGGPGLARDASSDALVELVDVMPTVLDLAGIASTETHFGRSLVPLLRGETSVHRDYAFTEGGFLATEEPGFELPPPPYDLKGRVQHEHPEAVGRCIAVRDHAWTYVWRMYEPCELYSRVDDPREQRNVAALPEHAERIERMHRALLDWLLHTSDVMSMAPTPRFPEIHSPSPAVRLNP